MYLKLIFLLMMFAGSFSLILYEVYSYKKDKEDRSIDFLIYSRNRIVRRLCGIFVIILISSLIYIQLLYPDLITTHREVWYFLGTCFFLLLILGVIAAIDMKETLGQLVHHKDKSVQENTEELRQILLDHTDKLKNNKDKTIETDIPDNKNSNN